MFCDDVFYAETLTSNRNVCNYFKRYTMKLTEAVLCKHTGAYDLELVKRLDLSNQNITSLSGIELCPNITELNLSSNSILTIEPLAALTQLIRLDVSNNQIQKLIIGLGTLIELNHLKLENNNITSMDELRVLSQLPKLKNFYLQNKKKDSTNETNETKSDSANPICDHPAYTTTLLRYAPDLQVLDGERIQLRNSTQKAMLDALSIPTEKLEIPERTRWMDGFDWDTSDVEGKMQFKKKAKKPRPGNKKIENTKPVPWTSMFSEEFVDAATNDATIKFNLTVEESGALDMEAEALLNSVNE